MWNVVNRFTRKKPRIYLDHASTTPVLPEVLTAMAPYWSEQFGNPGALYAEGVEAARAVAQARVAIARLLSVREQEITFTSGGTEANNIALFGLYKQKVSEGILPTKMHFISTALEHSSVVEPLRELEAYGARVTYVPVHEDGLIDLHALKAVLCPETVLISIHLVNNEIGVIQPVRDVARLLAEHYKEGERPVLHSDASQAPLYLDVSLERLGADLLTLDGQKMGGPKGIGALVHRHHIPLKPIMGGGGQEGGLRSGTEPVPLIVGLAQAMRSAATHRAERVARIGELRDRFLRELLRRVPSAVVNGSLIERIPNNVNVSIPGVDTEFLIIHMDKEGIALSTKSTCLTDEPASYTVAALGKDENHARSTLRITLGVDTTWRELKRTLDTLVSVIRKLDKK